MHDVLKKAADESEPDAAKTPPRKSTFF